MSGAALAAVAPGTVNAQQTTPQNAIPPGEALQRLMDGNARYAAGTGTCPDYSVGRADRALGQHPVATILSCADSRVAPELVFDQGSGDLFVLRVAGNTVNTDGLASIEYGVSVLAVPLIMVLGHSSCGAVGAAIKVVKENAVLPGHLPQLIDSIRPAVETVLADNSSDPLADATVENVRHSVETLKYSSAIVAEAAAAGQIEIVGGVYDIATGKVGLV